MDEVIERPRVSRLSEARLEARRQAGIPAHLVTLPAGELARLAKVNRSWINKAIKRGLTIVPREPWPEKPVDQINRKRTMLGLRFQKLLYDRGQCPLCAIYFARMRT